MRERPPSKIHQKARYRLLVWSFLILAIVWDENCLSYLNRQ